MVVVDTSVWIDFFRGRNEEVIAPLRLLIRQDRVALTGVIIAEVLQGILSPEEERIVERHFFALPYLEATRQTWRHAGALSRMLRNKGTTLPLTDIVVAAVALENSAAVYTADRHFRRIPGLRLHP